jgi:uncharacterized RDD family membrane protein YckC
MNQENRYQPPKAEVSDVATVGDSEMASRGLRFGAAMIDGIIGAAIVGSAMFFSNYWTKAMAGTATYLDQLALAPVGLVAFLVVHGYLLHTSGQTVGKRLVGTRIVSVDENRILPLWKVFVLRFLPISVVAQIPFVGQALSLVDALFIFRDDKRCLHDIIAGTKVVQAGATWAGRVELNSVD